MNQTIRTSVVLFSCVVLAWGQPCFGGEDKIILGPGGKRNEGMTAPAEQVQRIKERGEQIDAAFERLGLLHGELVELAKDARRLMRDRNGLTLCLAVEQVEHEISNIVSTKTKLNKEQKELLSIHRQTQRQIIAEIESAKFPCPRPRNESR